METQSASSVCAINSSAGTCKVENVARKLRRRRQREREVSAASQGEGEAKKEVEEGERGAMELDEQAFLEELFSLRRDATAAWECNAMGDFFSPACGAGAAGMDCFQERHQPTVSVLPTFTASFEQPHPQQHQQHQHAAGGFGGIDCLSEVYGGGPFPNAVGGGYGEMGVSRRDGPQGGGGWGRPRRLQGGARAGGRGRRRVRVGSDGGVGPGAGVEEEAGGGHAVQEPDGGAPAPQAAQRPPLHAPLRRAQDQQGEKKAPPFRFHHIRIKILGMDRTSILGDTIDYMKELLERIRRLQEEMEEAHPGQPAAAAPLLSVFRELNPNEMLARNTPKFEVERKEEDTRVEIYCAAKPGLLLSTVSTLDTLGLDIQQCVVSCFNDFAMHASCSEMQREMISADAIKQELFKNAGYGGGCL
uniref:Plant bHLH transcription factor ACT-like domain-containing protein n=1 Tax=Aegilops tauschii TaxID=37682 RepID=M8B155_AEGTA